MTGILASISIDPEAAGEKVITKLYVKLRGKVVKIIDAVDTYLDIIVPLYIDYNFFQPKQLP